MGHNARHRIFRRTRDTSLCGAMPILLLTSAVATAQTVQPAGDPGDIVVTANKQVQREIDVPASLDVLSGAALAANRVTRIEDLAAALPNVDVAEFSDGQYRLIYRGIGATGTSDNQNFNTAIDTVIVPYGRAYRLLDLDRVEVLRGPQGTLYGRNTNAGVINIVPNDGRNGAPATISAAYGRGDTVNLSAAAGGKVDNSDFFYRLAGRYETTQGFITNSLLGKDDAHRGRNGTVRGILGWAAGPWLAKLSFTYDQYSGDSDDLVRLATPFVSRAPDIGRSSGRLLLPVLTVSHSDGAVDFTSTTAYADTRRDLTFSAVVSPVLLGQFDRYQSFSQEFRLNGKTPLGSANFEWVAGTYYLHETNPFRSTTTLTTLGLLLLDQNQKRTTDAYALFGEASYDLTAHWHITAGLRVGTEHQNVSYMASATAPQAVSRENYPTVQPKLVAAYRWGDGQVYGSITRGFRAGSVFVGNAPARSPAYKDEGTWQYELGYKGRFADRRIGIEAAIFYIDWSDLQIQRSIISSTTPFAIVTVVDNATSARSWGGEASLDWKPVRDLTLFAKGGYTNARYRDYAPTPTTSYAGNRIEMVPDFSVALGGGWRPVTGLGMGADIARVGTMPFDAANSVTQHGYTLMNADLSYTTGPVRLAIVGHNLLDSAYANRGLVNAGSAYVHFADPRTVTGDVTLRF